MKKPGKRSKGVADPLPRSASSGQADSTGSPQADSTPSTSSHSTSSVQAGQAGSGQAHSTGSHSASSVQADSTCSPQAGQAGSPQAWQALRQKAEALALEKASRVPKDSSAISPAEIQKTLHELRVHQIELEMQNEELRSAQAEIEAGRARYFDLYDLAPVGYCTISGHGLILEVNLTAATLLGTTRAALVNQPLTRFIFKDDQDSYYLQRKILFEKGAPRECDLRLVKLDGTFFWAHMTAAVSQADDAAPVSRVAISDITKRKLAEQHLRESESRLRMLTEESPLAIYETDAKGDCIYVNKTWCEFAGMQAEEAMGQGWRRGLHPDDRQRISDLWREHAISGMPWCFEYRFITRYGKVTWVYGTTQQITDDTGAVTGYLGMNVDITERKQAEEALRESEEKFNKAFNLNPNTLAIIDIDTLERVAINDYFAKLVGYSKEELMNAPLGSLGEIDINKVQLGVKAVKKGLSLNDIEVNLTDKKGIKRIMLYAVVGIQIGGRNCMMVSGKDITELKQAEQEKEKLQAQLIQAQKMEAVGRLAGGVAHDFNNMLGVILGHTELMMMSVAPTEPLHVDLEEIQKAVLSSSDLTKQLLAFARKQTVVPKVINLNDTVADMIKMLKRLIGEDIEMSWAPGGNVWPVKIDPGQIGQILVNLCVNARDAIIKDGKVTIGTSNTVFDEAYCNAHAEYEPGEYAMLTVSDSGCGMDSGTMSHLFEPFFTTKELGRGTGLGLSTVYGIVKQNKGFITVYSEPGSGTTFKICLPRHAITADCQSEKASVQVPECGHATILLVEDTPELLRTITKMLEFKGYTVLGASSPGEAIRLVREHPSRIDLLLTDIIMPDMNGRDLAKKILSVYPGLKCMFMSGYTAEIIGRQGVLDKGEYFIEKPFSAHTLIEKICEALKGA